MIDRKKAIKGLECCAYKKNCNECPYFKGNATCMDDKDKDALELLKEQETVKPKKIKGYNPPMYTLYEYECEKCESPMMNRQPFCMGCGRKVKWE